MKSLTEKKMKYKKRRNEPPQKHFECLLKSVFFVCLFIECKEQAKHITFVVKLTKSARHIFLILF